MKQKTSIALSDRTRDQIDTLAAYWGMDGDGQRYTGAVIETAVTRALLFEQIAAAGGSFSEAVAPYRPDTIAAVLTDYMQRCITTDERGDGMTRAIIYDIAIYFGLNREQADRISETEMQG